MNLYAIVVPLMLAVPHTVFRGPLLNTVPKGPLVQYTHYSGAPLTHTLLRNPLLHPLLRSPLPITSHYSGSPPTLLLRGPLLHSARRDTLLHTLLRGPPTYTTQGLQQKSIRDARWL